MVIGECSVVVRFPIGCWGYSLALLMVFGREFYMEKLAVLKNGDSLMPNSGGMGSPRGLMMRRCLEV